MENEVNVGALMLLIMGGTGLLLALAGILIFIFEKRKKDRCTAVTTGTVTRYSFINGAPSPVVSYTVGGTAYERKRKFRGVVTVRTSFSPGDLKGKNQSCYISENDVVHIRAGSVLNLRSMAESLYPPGSSLPVWYDPDKPGRSYAEKIPEKSSIVGWVFFWVGLGFTAIGVFLYCVL